MKMPDPGPGHPMYVPILKGKPGEFEAWRHAAPEVVGALRPVFEVVPTKGPDSDLRLFVERLALGWPPAAVATVDTSYVSQSVSVAGGPAGAVLWTAQELHARSVRARPVIRLGANPAVVAEVAAAAQLHREGVCLRLGDPAADPDIGAADAALDGLLRDLGLGLGDVHLLIDMWEVASTRDVSRALQVAEAGVVWAESRGRWASVTVAAGAFPRAISQLALNTSTDIPRHDAALWVELCQRPGLPMVPDFGDYAINHPSMPSDTPRGPLPNLRYTFDGDWRVFRERKVLPGNQSFLTLCARVVSDHAWPGNGVAHCWGDSEINRCARSAGSPGGATQWRAYGTSHHLATVCDRLANLHVP
jgi:hypothetical protein